MTAHLKPINGEFSRFFDKGNSEKYKIECLGKIEEFAEALIAKGNHVKITHDILGLTDIVGVVINRKVIYEFYMDGVSFWYRIVTKSL